MIRLFIGLFIVLGAVGHEDFMVEQGVVTSIDELIVKCLVGFAFMGFGLAAMKRRGQLDEYI